MIARVDSRDVVERAMDAVSAAEWDLTHAKPVERCECGATLLAVGVVDGSGGFVCAGCGLVPTYRLHRGPAANASTSGHGEGAACHAVLGRGGRVSSARSLTAAGLAARLARSFLSGWRA